MDNDSLLDTLITTFIYVTIAASCFKYLNSSTIVRDEEQQKEYARLRAQERIKHQQEIEKMTLNYEAKIMAIKSKKYKRGSK